MQLQCCWSLFTLEIANGLKFREKRQFLMIKVAVSATLENSEYSPDLATLFTRHEVSKLCLFRSVTKNPNFNLEKMQKTIRENNDIRINLWKDVYFIDFCKKKNDKVPFYGIFCSFINLFVCPEFVGKIPHKMSAVA